MFLVTMFFLLGLLCLCLGPGAFLFAFLAVFLSMTWRVWEGTKVPLLVQWANSDDPSGWNSCLAKESDLLGGFLGFGLGVLGCAG